eukprot:4726148-Prymnesium_polylepis.1
MPDSTRCWQPAAEQRSRRHDDDGHSGRQSPDEGRCRAAAGLGTRPERRAEDAAAARHRAGQQHFSQ